MIVDFEGIEIIIEHSQFYLQINDISAAELERIWDKLKRDYGGYDKWFCFHNCEIPYDFLEKIGAGIEDDSIEMRLKYGDFNFSSSDEVYKVEENNFAEFAIYHDLKNPEMYWSGDKLAADLSRWGIFALGSEGKILEYVMIFVGNSEVSEIFCLEASKKTHGEKLIKSACEFAFEKGKKEVLFMADEGTIGYDCAVEAGFKATGFYKGFAVKRQKP